MSEGSKNILTIIAGVLLGLAVLGVGYVVITLTSGEESRSIDNAVQAVPEGDQQVLIDSFSRLSNDGTFDVIDILPDGSYCVWMNNYEQRFHVRVITGESVIAGDGTACDDYRQ